MIKDKNKPVAIWPGLKEGVPKPIMPYSPAVKVGDWLFIAGQLASDFKTGVPNDLIPENGDPSHALQLQSEFVLRNMKQTVQAAGFNMKKDTVRIWEWFVSDRPDQDDYLNKQYTHQADLDAYKKSYIDYFDAKNPIRSTAGIKELMWVNTKVELEVMCYMSSSDEDKIFLHSDSSDSGAIKKDEWVFVSNQTPIDENGDAPISFEEQLETVIEKTAFFVSAFLGADFLAIFLPPLRSGGVTIPPDTTILTASSTSISRNTTSFFGQNSKNPDVGFGVVGIKTLTMS